MRVDPVKVKRFKRWLFPASTLSLASLALGVLVLTEVSTRELSSSAPNAGAPRRVGSPTQGRVRARPSAGGMTPVDPLPAVARRPRPNLGTTNAQAPQRPHADPALAKLHAARTLQERMHTVDELIEGLAPDAAVAMLSRLLDARLPGSIYEERTLRLTVLARIGAQPGPASEAILLRSTADNRPRPERLIAIEFLSGRSSAARERLQTLADTDSDTVVQKKARWALARGK